MSADTLPVDPVAVAIKAVAAFHKSTKFPYKTDNLTNAQNYAALGARAMLAAVQAQEKKPAARIKDLENALRPFAEAHDGFEAYTRLNAIEAKNYGFELPNPDSIIVVSITADGKPPMAGELRVSDLRRARDLLVPNDVAWGLMASEKPTPDLSSVLFEDVLFAGSRDLSADEPAPSSTSAGSPIGCAEFVSAPHAFGGIFAAGEFGIITGPSMTQELWSGLPSATMLPIASGGLVDRFRHVQMLGGGSPARMEPHEAGEWMRFADHEEVLEARDREIARFISLSADDYTRANAVETQLAAKDARTAELEHDEVLSPLELDILRCCAGYPTKLPYNAAQREATERLKKMGLVVGTYEDDQPTYILTDAGRAAFDLIMSSSGDAAELAVRVALSEQVEQLKDDACEQSLRLLGLKGRAAKAEARATTAENQLAALKAEVEAKTLLIAGWGPQCKFLEEENVRLRAEVERKDTALRELLAFATALEKQSGKGVGSRRGGFVFARARAALSNTGEVG